MKYRMLCKAFVFFDVEAGDDKEALQKAEELKIRCIHGFDLPKGAMVEGLPFDPDGKMDIAVYPGAASPVEIISRGH